MALQRFPGFIDVHAHLRDPGSTEKEDFTSASRSAVIGGFTYIVDMPNNPGMPTISPTRLEEKIRLSSKKAICDIGFYYGTNGVNIETFSSAIKNSNVFGLKIYCNHTTGELLIQDRHVLEITVKAWNTDKPILVHAEGEQLSICIDLARRYQKRLHVCHVARASAIFEIKKAKEKGQVITCGVTPHHLFLTKEHVKSLGSFALVKPEIGDEKDRIALWQALISGSIDVIETDHSPHTKAEKESSTLYYGVPGLETTVGLLMKAVYEQKLTLNHIRTFLYDNPKRIFHIPDQPHTYTELDPEIPYYIGKNGYVTKCGWSPYDGWEAYGKVQTVVLRGKQLVREGRLV